MSSEITNEPQNILSAWTALEVLSPQGFREEADLAGGKKINIDFFDQGGLPWVLGGNGLPKKRLYYEVILGTIKLGPAVARLCF